ncbi:4Fe-4S dicluster domain-containing protein [Candidatus Bathyarchaeota archaeon]|nr:4Fe-4S dicluster domain-containing protein [Candidatus Bathyarchaeota archaeon]
MVTINVDQEKCTGCGTCVTTCPVGVYELRKASYSEKSFSVNADQCIVCRACEAVCPASAIKVVE